MLQMPGIQGKKLWLKIWTKPEVETPIWRISNHTEPRKCKFTRWNFNSISPGSWDTGISGLIKAAIIDLPHPVWSYIICTYAIQLLFLGMTLNCIHIFIVTGSLLYWCVMRPASQRFFIHSCRPIYLRILIISYLATFLWTNRLSILMCRKAVNQLINCWISKCRISRWHFVFICSGSRDRGLGAAIFHFQISASSYLSATIVALLSQTQKSWDSRWNFDPIASV